MWGKEFDGEGKSVIKGEATGKEMMRKTILTPVSPLGNGATVKWGTTVYTYIKVSGMEKLTQETAPQFIVAVVVWYLAKDSLERSPYSVGLYVPACYVIEDEKKPAGSPPAVYPYLRRVEFKEEQLEECFGIIGDIFNGKMGALRRKGEAEEDEFEYVHYSSDMISVVLKAVRLYNAMFLGDSQIERKNEEMVTQRDEQSEEFLNFAVNAEIYLLMKRACGVGIAGRKNAIHWMFPTQLLWKPEKKKGNFAQLFEQMFTLIGVNSLTWRSTGPNPLYKGFDVFVYAVISEWRYKMMAGDEKLSKDPTAASRLGAVLMQWIQSWQKLRVEEERRMEEWRKEQRGGNVAEEIDEENKPPLEKAVWEMLPPEQRKMFRVLEATQPEREEEDEEDEEEDEESSL